MAQASLVLGILSLIFTLIPGNLGGLGLICAIVGIITGSIARRDTPEYHNTATAGLILSVVAILVRLVVVIACAACMLGVASLL